MPDLRKEKKTLSKRLALLVASAVVVTQIGATVTPVLAEGNSIDNIKVEQDALVEQRNQNVYTVLFDGSENNSWKTLIGSGTNTVENGYLKITRDTAAGNDFVFFDENAPQIKDGEAEMVFKVDGDDSKGGGRFGFALRPQTDGAHLFVGYDLNGNWKIGTNGQGEKIFAGPNIEKGREYKLQVRFVGKKIDIYLDGQEIFSETVDINIPTESSYGVGFKTWYGVNDSYVDHFSVGPVGSVIVDEAKELESVQEVTVDTYQRVRPNLPNNVRVTYVDGTSGNEEVSWDHIDKEKYAELGTFQVGGTITNRETRVTATVNVVEAPEGEIVPPEVTVEEKILNQDNMSVYLDNNFPRVIRYQVGEDILQGEEDQLYIVELNDEQYVPKVEYEEVNDYTGIYIMTFKDIDVVMKMKVELIDSNTLRMEVISIEESGHFKVKTINIPEHNLATVKSTENGKISSVLTTGDWNNIKESFDDVSGVAVGTYNKTYGIINNDKFAIAIDNNVIEGGNRLTVNVANKDGYKQASISNGAWTYREPLNSSADPSFIGTVGGVEISGGTNQPIISESTNIKKFMNKEYEAVYCGLGGVEDFEGKDLNGKVAIVDRGTHTFEDKARNAEAAGAAFIICINNVEGDVPNQGVKSTINMVGLSSTYKDSIMESLDENNTTTINLSLEDGGIVPGDPEELPWSQISIAKDTNDNGKVDWQDAAILYREDMEPVVGAEDIPNSFSYIPFNIGSLTQSPFLRSADMIKKLSNYTDGFGQLVLEKGYQGEGHDDVIADIGGHTGIRQGGKDDLNKLIEIGKDYNAKVGVHVNVTEYHLDAFELAVENLKSGFQKGWSWKDNSYYVDQRKDITSGELKRRFDMLKADHPDLGWVYVDVYTGNGWNANELADIINDNDWMLATEFNGPLEQQTAWTHWGGDPAYPNRGNESKIIRFLRNQEQDVFMSDDLLKGGKHMLSGGWGTKHDVEGFYAVDSFYNQTLPSKYMQHFEIQEWEDDGTTGFVKFNDDLESRREDGKINMYKDGKLIASTDQSTINDRGIGKTQLFLHWTWEELGEEPENKVYHWNPYGGETTWDLPTEWLGTETVKLYELSDLGRTFVKEIPIVDGKVTIDAKTSTPYVVFQEKVSEPRIDNWGEGTLIDDPGFDSQTLDKWTVETTADNMDHINIVNEQVEGRKGNDALVIQGEVKPDLSVIPQEQMTAVVSNSQQGEDGSKAIDGDKTTLWHTDWNGVQMPQSITVDLGGNYEIDKFTVLPRQSGDNGKIRKYEVQVSTDGANFTKIAEGNWDDSSDLKVVKFDPVNATHIKLIALGTIGAYASIAELNVHQKMDIPESEKNTGKDAKISQDIEGLEPGKTYTASVWVKSDGNRDITLGVDCDGEKTTSTITRATKRTNVGEGLKWNGEKLTRMRVEFIVPEGVTTAKLYLDVAKSEEDTLVMIDDFRIWTNPLGTETVDRDGYILYEDFENVDEGHGPLYMGQRLGTDNRTHFAERNPEGGQYMNWVIDGRFSLKTNQQQGTTGEMLVTDESTLQLKPNTTYELGFEYTNKIDDLYSISIKSPTAGVLFEESLTPGTVVGNPEDGENYSREVKEYKIVFTTDNAADYYLAFNKGNGFDELVLDNLYVKDIKVDLQTLIGEAEKLVSKDYTAESWAAFSEALNTAKAVVDKEKATEAEVNEAKANLQESIDSLAPYVFNGHLQIAIEEADKVTEEELSKVVPAVVEEFKAALAEAKELLANPKSTQEQVNDSWERLSSAMHMLSFYKGDKTHLTNLVEKINRLNGDEYIKGAWNNLQKVLEVANKVIANENSMEKEVSETYESLMKAFLELRLKPSKEKLEELINKAENIDRDNYTKDSLKVLDKALKSAKKVFANEDAIEEEIAEVEKNLEVALSGLVENGDNNNSGNGSNNGNGNNGNDGDGNGSGSGKLPNTGGVNAVSVGLLGSLSALVGVLLFKKKNK